jgi:hypothetical protein
MTKSAALPEQQDGAADLRIEYGKGAVNSVNGDRRLRSA